LGSVRRGESEARRPARAKGAAWVVLCVVGFIAIMYWIMSWNQYNEGRREEMRIWIQRQQWNILDPRQQEPGQNP
jgi:hypothetical protein